MQISQLEAFVEIARLGSITRAADALFITQPTVTERLRALEREAGQPLFTRNAYGVALTDAGKALLPYAKRILQNVSEAKAALADLATAAPSELAIGAALFVNLHLLPVLLERFTRAHPGVRIAVRTGHSEDVLGMVLRDEVQVGLIRRLDHRDVQAIKLCKDEILLIAAPDHPFGRLESVTMEQIAQEGVISHDRGTSYCKLIDTLFHDAGVSLRVRAETDNLETAIGMVQKGLGVTLLTRTAVQREIEAGTLTSVPITGSPLPSCELIAVYRKSSGLSGIAQDFVTSVQETLPA